MQSKIITAEKAFIGDFEIGENAKTLFGGWIDVTSDTRPDDNYIKMHLGWYFHVEDLFDPLVGDVRLKFQVAGLQDTTYTIVGKLTNGKIQPYKSNLKKEILLLSRGELTIDQIFREEHHTVRKKTWFIRFFGFVLIFFGVISTNDLLRVCELKFNENLDMENNFNFIFLVARTRFSFLCPNPRKQFKSNLKIAAILTATICVLRQALHYVGIKE
jgi:hypothetical protein